MVNITKTINEYLLDNVLSGLFDIIYNDVFPEDIGEYLVSRHDPSTASERSFIDGSAEGNLSIAYYMRSDDAEKCRMVLDTIIDELDGLSITDEEGTEIRITSINLPSFVSLDEKEQVIYTCLINALYNRNGEL